MMGALGDSCSWMGEHQPATGERPPWQWRVMTVMVVSQTSHGSVPRSFIQRFSLCSDVS